MAREVGAKPPTVRKSKFVKTLAKEFRLVDYPSVKGAVKLQIMNPDGRGIEIMMRSKDELREFVAFAHESLDELR